MKKLISFLLLVISFAAVKAQTEVYTIGTGEMIFQWGEIDFTDEYKLANPQEEQLNSPMRFSMFFHIGSNVHVDLSDHFGIFSGLGLRNVGLTSNERLIDPDGSLQDYKIIRRSYNLGVPFAFKVGSFDKHTYLYFGGEVELQFAYKEKYWDSHNRSGSKSKYHEWFGDQTNTFVTSGFVGFQFPKGINVKFKYYFNDFLNHSYRNPNNKISDLTRYASSNIMYISLSWQIRNDEFFKRKSKIKNTGSIEDVQTSYLR